VAAPSLNPSPEAAWNALWNAKRPYDLPSAIIKGRRVGLVHVRPLDSVTFPDTGRIILMNRDRWGSVAINFKQNAVSGLDTLVNRGFQFNSADNSFTGKIEFRELSLSGEYSITRGRATGSALRLASRSFGSGIGEVGDDSNITLAKQYQNELITSDSGRVMVGAYYDHNQAYCRAFQYPTFVYYYQSYVVPGAPSDHTTSFFAQQTADAASTQNRNSKPVNQDPYYTAHALAISNFLIAACNYNKDHDAAIAASQFCGATQPFSGSPQTVGQVMNTVSNTPPPNTAPTPCNSNSGLSSTIDGFGRTIIPDWRKMHGWTQEIADSVETIVRKIEAGDKEAEFGLTVPEERGGPITGGFLDRFSSPVFTVTGTIGRDERNDPAVTITGLTGDSPQVNVRLAPFAGDLFPEVSQALDKAKFLKALLGKRVALALAEPAFLNYVGRMLTLALGQKLGPLDS
jgi:hypothetical protein